MEPVVQVLCQMHNKTMAVCVKLFSILEKRMVNNYTSEINLNQIQTLQKSQPLLCRIHSDRVGVLLHSGQFLRDLDRQVCTASGDITGFHNNYDHNDDNNDLHIGAERNFKALCTHQRISTAAFGDQSP